MKRKVIHFLRVFLAFAAGSYFFSNHIIAKNSYSAISAAIIFCLVGELYGLCLRKIKDKYLNKNNAETKELPIVILFVLIMSFAIVPIQFWIVESVLPEFSIIGFWTYILLFIAIYFGGFTFKHKKIVQNK